jgi:hypothetical protein
MFRTVARLFLPNPLDWMLKRAAKAKKTKILIGWNRGLGDIALGLYAIVHRIREFIPEAEITFLIRANLRDGFAMLRNVRILEAPDWKRGEKSSCKKTLLKMGIDPKRFDLIIERPSPTDWVRWQRGKLVPKLNWNPAHDELWKSFGLSSEFTYIAVQPVAETTYGLWRNWSASRWNDLFLRLGHWNRIRVLLFGHEASPLFQHPNVIDLRGKTSLFEMLSIIKNRCRFAILPDSGILSMIYYLDVSFPIHIISLWADPNHGILKQGVFSPNPLLVHSPLIGENRDLSSVSAKDLIAKILPAEPLQSCRASSEIEAKREDLKGVGAILLAGGEGSRLGHAGPKGLFIIEGKSLFQWILEKLPPEMPVAVMTSPLNYKETVDFFQQKQFFGRNVSFFQQSLLPFLGSDRKPLEHLAPDGNGSLFKSFAESGLLDRFEGFGIDLVSIVPIENILADPADPVFISFARDSGADAIVKCIERKAGDPPMGALVTREGRLEIVEYTEADAHTEYRYCYTGMMAMKLSFLKQMAAIDLPLHWVWKKAGKEFAWKGERFIFDALPYAGKAEALLFPKSQIYAPLKSRENLEELARICKEMLCPN